MGQVNIVNGIAAEDGGQGMPLQGAAITVSNGAAFATTGSPLVNNNFTLNGGAGPNANSSHPESRQWNGPLYGNDQP